MTPVVLLTDAFIANGSSAWRIPDEGEYPEIKPNYVPEELKATWKPYQRNDEMTRYWAIPGTPGLCHCVGGLEKDYETGIISNRPENHERMVKARALKVANVARHIPELAVKSEDEGAEILLLGWGGTYGHNYTAWERLSKEGVKIDFAQLKYINPLPLNTGDVLSRYKTVIVSELNSGQLATYLQSQFPQVHFERINKVQGQPFFVQEIVDGVKQIIKGGE